MLPQCYPPPIITPKMEVLKTMPIWVLRQAQRSGRQLEAWFQVATKLCLGSRSNKPIADISFLKITYLKEFFLPAA